MYCIFIKLLNKKNEIIIINTIKLIVLIIISMFYDSPSNTFNQFNNLFCVQKPEPMKITGFVFLVLPSKYTYNGITDIYQIGMSYSEGISSAINKGAVQRIFMCTDPSKVFDDIITQLKSVLQCDIFDNSYYVRGNIKIIIQIFNQISDKYVNRGCGYFPQIYDLQKDFCDFKDDISIMGNKRLIKISVNDKTITYMERCKIRKINYVDYLTGDNNKQFFKKIYAEILHKCQVHDISTKEFLTRVYNLKQHVIPNCTVPIIKNLAEKYTRTNANTGDIILVSQKQTHNNTHHYVINNLLKNGYIKCGTNLIDCIIEKYPHDSRYVDVTVDSCGIPGPFETHKFTFEIKNGYYHQINLINNIEPYSCFSDDESL